MLKAGKLDRPTYLKLAATVTVGFQKRLTDCRAAERYLHDQAVREVVQAHVVALKSAMLPMKTFPLVEDCCLVSQTVYDITCVSNLYLCVCLCHRSFWFAGFHPLP